MEITTRRVHTPAAAASVRARNCREGSVVNEKDPPCPAGSPPSGGSPGITARGMAAVLAAVGVIFLAAAASYFFLFPEPHPSVRVIARSLVIIGLSCVVAGLPDVYSGRAHSSPTDSAATLRYLARHAWRSSLCSRSTKLIRGRPLGGPVPRR